jgi:hypothetical protein
VKNIGKPCALVAHARFDEGGQVRACSLLYPLFYVQKHAHPGESWEVARERLGAERARA